MNTSAINTMNLLGVVLGIIIFLILFPIILKSLRCMPFFQGRTSIFTAGCVTLLSILGLFRFLAVPGEPASKSNPDRISFDFILLPYAAMALAILLILLLMRIRKVFDLSQKHLSDDRKTQTSKYSGTFESQEHTTTSENTPCEDKTTNKRRKDVHKKLKPGNILSKECSDREFK